MSKIELELPAMLYKPGDEIEWDGKRFDTVVVTDDEELEIAMADGWLLPKDALAAADKKAKPKDAPA